MIVVKGVIYYLVKDFDLPVYVVHGRARMLMIENVTELINGRHTRIFTEDQKKMIENYEGMGAGRPKRTEPRVCIICGKDETEVNFPNSGLYCGKDAYRKQISKPIGKKAFVEKFNKEAWK